MGRDRLAMAPGPDRLWSILDASRLADEWVLRIGFADRRMTGEGLREISPHRCR